MEKLEVFELQVLLGGEEGIDQTMVKAGFVHEVMQAVGDKFKEHGIPVVAIHQGWENDERYNGVDRQFHQSRVRYAIIEESGEALNALMEPE